MAMFKNLKLKYSILLGYTIPLALSVIVAVIVYTNIKKVEYQSKMAENANQIHVDIKDLIINVGKMQRAARGYLLLKNETSYKNHEAAEKGYEELSQRLIKAVKDSKQQENLKKVIEVCNKVSADTKKTISFINEGKQQMAMEYYRSGTAFAADRELDGILNDFDKREEEIRYERTVRVNELISILGKVLFFGIMLAIIIALILGLWISSRISRTIVDAVASASATSTEIAATISQHERTANQQASMVNETTTTLEELSASSRQSAEQAESAAAMAKKANTLTEEGDAAVRQALEAMEGLKIKVGAVAEQILSLSEQTGQIGIIAELVKDLAAQINMLALNAAVEAARAGEHGKGFAVVSAEVRKLAVESKKSAEQAKAIVSGIQKATDTTIMKTEEGTKNIEDVAVIAQKVGNLFEALSETAGSVYNNAQQVLLNTKQQSSAIGQVVEAANNIKAGAKETAAGISQTKIGIQNLNEATERLKQMV
jgi:methyl-accepting chemotaxis protein